MREASPDRSAGFARAAMAAELLDAETERDLALRWRDKRDDAALHRLVTAYLRLAIAMASRYRRYGASMNDLVQEAGVGLMKAASKFDPDRGVKFSTWLFTSVKNLCYDHLRKRRLPTESLDRAAGDDEDRAPLQVASPGRTPHETTETGELGQRIAKAVQRLPMDQRVVFVLREYERFSYEEIAQMTETSIGTVKSRLFRAKENLRFMLSDYVRTT